MPRDRLPENEAEILASLRQGEQAGFEALVRRYGGRLLATARRLLRNEEDARDCLQDSLLKVFERIDQFEGRSSLATWLHRIVVNTALMKLRAQTRKAEESIDPLLPDFDERGCRIEPDWNFPETVEGILLREETREAVRDKIAALPETYRIVLMLRDIEELSTAEAAELLEVSEGTVKVRLHRARAALKKLLEPLWQEAGP